MSTFEQNVEAHHRLTYSDNVMMVAQQKANRLRPAVTVKSGLTGEAHSVADLFGALDYSRVGPRVRTNPENQAQGSRRWLVRPDEFIYAGQYIDKEDKWDTAMDPTGSIVATQVATVERGVFDTILGIVPKSDGSFEVGLGGILGTAVSGKRKETSSALPSGNTVASGSAGLTLDKLREAKKDMKLAEFGMEDDDPLYGVITPNQEDDLLAIAAATASSLNQFSIEQLRTGKPTMLMGINWICTNRLPVNSSSERLVPIFSKKNICLGFWEETNGDIWNDTHAQNLPYARTRAMCDAVRIQDGGVRVIACTES